MNIRYVINLIIFTIAGVLPAVGTNWDSMISVSSISELLIYDDQLYLGTDGGLLIQEGSGDFTQFGPEDGLSDFILTGLVKDFRGQIWCLGEKGEISIFNPQTKVFTKLGDLSGEDLNYVAVAADDNSVYILYDNLFVKYIYNSEFSRYQIKETNSMIYNPRDLVLSSERVYLLEENVYSIEKTASNYSDLSLWKIEVPESQITDSGIWKIESFNEKIICFSEDALYEIRDGSLVNVFSENSRKFNDLFCSDNYIYLADSNNELYEIAISDNLYSIERTTSLKSSPAELLINHSGIYYSSGKNLKFKSSFESNEENIYYNAPFIKGFKKGLIADDNFYLLANYDLNYYNISNNSWGHNNPFEVPKRGLLTDMLFTNDSLLFIGAWGTGLHCFSVTEREDDSLAFRYKKNLKVSSTTENEYYVHSGLAKLADKVLFSVYYDYTLPAQKNIIYSLNPEEIDPETDNFKLDSLVLATSSFKSANKLFVTKNNYLCVTSATQSLGAKDGLLVYNLMNQGRNQFTSVGATTCLYHDENDTLWVGTAENAYKILLRSSAVGTAKEYLNTLGKVIYKIIESPAGDLWFATELGITVKSKNGTVFHYLKEDFEGNLPLEVKGEIYRVPFIDTAINDIIFYNDLVYLVSENGVVSFDYDESDDYADSKNIATIPAPFKAGGGRTGKFNFTVQDYDRVKIFDIRGRLVREIKEKGESVAFFNFDGKDKDNKYLSSGIYQIIAYKSSEPARFKTGKIAIIRED